MCVGVIILWFSVPIALGSLLGLIPAALLAALIVVRTHFEDRTLFSELEGYREYPERVRHRLLRGIW